MCPAATSAARRTGARLALVALMLGAYLPIAAQGAAASVPAAAAAPSWAGQLAGTWVSLITDNWRMRMVTPPKGDYVGIPLTAAAAKLADQWDPARDTASGQACRSYGAAMIMMRPEHLQIAWQDATTLLMQIDAGRQMRTFHFNAAVPAASAPSWQGYSTAAWISRATPGLVASPPDARYLHVRTSHLLPGYLRQNGIPYSAQAVLTENYDLARQSDAETYLIVTSSVTDPIDLDYPLQLSAIFRKEPNNAGWDPTPCSSTW